MCAEARKVVPPLLVAISSDAPYWEPNDQFEVQIDHSLLELDYISFSSLSNLEFTTLFPEPEVRLLGLRPRAHLDAKVDYDNKALHQKNLCKYLNKSLRSLTLRFIEANPCTFEVLHPNSFGADLPVTSLDEEVQLLPGAHRILHRVAMGEWDRSEVLTLHDQACQQVLSRPLDKLVSLSTLPDFVPFPHQVQAVKAVISKFRGRALLCDEVGLGKTIEACLVMMEYLQRGLATRVLILTPASLTGQWQEELRRKFCLDFVVSDEERFQGWHKHDQIIASLSGAKLSPHREQLAEQEFDLIIVDEAHHLRNRNTKAWQLIDSLKKRYMLFLTATPLQNGISDVYNLVTLLKPGHLSTMSEFKRQFISTKGEREPKNINKLRGLLQTVMVRNKRSHTNVILTRRHAHTISLELTPEETRFYESTTHLVRRGSFREASGGSIGKSIVDSFTLQLLQLEVGSSVLAAMPTLLKLASRNLPQSYAKEVSAVIESGRELCSNYSRYCRKAEALVDIIKKFDDKVLVFTRFTETFAFLKKYLTESGFAVVTFNGSMRRAEKEASLKAFQSDAQILLSTESGGEGRNLQFCNALVNYDLPWNPMTIEQRIGRIHRLGQQRNVHVFNLSAAGTVEAHVLSLLDKKINLFELVVGEVDMILGNLEDKRTFEEVIFDLWTQSENEGEVKERLEELGLKLSAAKAQYLRSQELDDRVFGDALLSR